MAAGKRVKITTAEGFAAHARAREVGFKSPCPMSEADQTMFDIITSSRERSTFNQNDLFLAAQLAKMYVRLDQLNEQIDVEGFVVTNAKGTSVTNPLFFTMVQLTSSVQAMNRTLGLSGSGRGLNHPDQKARNLESRKLDDLHDATDGSELLA